MVGSERMPIEATLCGAVLLTGECQCGRDRRDFPIPARNVLKSLPMAPRAAAASGEESLRHAMTRILGAYERERADYAAMRRLYFGLGAQSMKEEARRFLEKESSGSGGAGRSLGRRTVE